MTRKELAAELKAQAEAVGPRKRETEARITRLQAELQEASEADIALGYEYSALMQAVGYLESS